MVNPHVIDLQANSSLKTQDNLDVVTKIPIDRLMIETDAPWCDIRPTHASFSYLSDAIYDSEIQIKKKFQVGHLVKGRNEPCTIL